jgi:peroxiredoxin
MPALDFKLPDFQGKMVALSDFAAQRAILLMFICNHCPFVKHVRGEFSLLRRDYRAEDVAIIAINANDIESYPQDGPEGMAREAREFGYTFPYLFDESQAVAKAYRAACTPDFYLFGPDRRLFYHGQLDDSRPGNQIPVTGRDLRAAIDALHKGDPRPSDQRPSVGCNIKWKPGNEPDYYGAAAR